MTAGGITCLCGASSLAIASPSIKIGDGTYRSFVEGFILQDLRSSKSYHHTQLYHKKGPGCTFQAPSLRWENVDRLVDQKTLVQQEYTILFSIWVSLDCCSSGHFSDADSPGRRRWLIPTQSSHLCLPLLLS